MDGYWKTAGDSGSLYDYHLGMTALEDNLYQQQANTTMKKCGSFDFSRRYKSYCSPRIGRTRFDQL